VVFAVRVYLSAVLGDAERASVRDTSSVTN